MWNKRKRENIEEYERKIRNHKKQLLIRLAAAGAVLVVLGIIAAIFLMNRSYDSYKTVASAKMKDGGNTIYKEFAGNILKAGRDGVSCLDQELTELWNQTYEMNSPMVDTCEGMAAVGDQGGNQIYIFNSDGLQGELETNLPIEKVKISEQGLTAVIMKGDSTNWINLYDKKGKKIAENKTSLSNTGFPLDVAISRDGYRMMVSYLHTSGSSMTTKIAFYNFGAVGQDKIDNLVSASEYKNVMAPVTAFMDNETSFALCDDRLLVFRGSQIPELVKKVKFKEEIQSAFYEEDRIGIIFKNSGKGKRYRLEIYDSNGKKKTETEFNTAYKKAVMSKGRIIVYGSSACTIFDSKGNIKYSGKIGNGVNNMLAVGSNAYLLVNSGRMKIIKLT